jgi:hypothetical protein
VKVSLSIPGCQRCRQACYDPQGPHKRTHAYAHPTAPSPTYPDPSVARFLTSWLLSTMTVLIIPPLFLLFTAYGRISRRYVREQLAASANATTVAEEAFSNLRTVGWGGCKGFQGLAGHFGPKSSVTFAPKMHSACYMKESRLSVHRRCLHSFCTGKLPTHGWPAASPTRTQAATN